jgi:hypothetical protein
MKETIRRPVRALLLAGGLAAGGAIAAVVGLAANPAAAVTGSGSALATGALASQAASTSGMAEIASTSGISGTGHLRGPGGWGFGGGPGRFGGGHGGFGRGGGLTVTGVSGNTITATGRGGQTITVQVSATTAYTEAGASASFSDVKTGSIIAVQGSFANTSGTTINATGVTIVLPTEAGVVTNVNGDTLTITGFDGTTHTVTLNGSTRYQKAGQSAAQSDVTTGTAIEVEGTLNSDGSLSAVRVTIQTPRLDGQVSAVNGSSYTIKGRGGSTYTVASTSSTVYVNADGSAATASAVKSGVSISAEGTLSSDGKTLTALRIVILPARGAFGPRGHGRFGGFGGALGTTPPSVTTPSVTSFGASGSPSV